MVDMQTDSKITYLYTAYENIEAMMIQRGCPIASQVCLSHDNEYSILAIAFELKLTLIHQLGLWQKKNNVISTAVNLNCITRTQVRYCIDFAYSMQ